jgi:hypothetical protein
MQNIFEIVCKFKIRLYICINKNGKQNEKFKTTLGLRNNIDQFSTLDGANRWANNCIKLHIVMLGDNGKYWVACFADAQKLSKNGL